MIGLTPYLAYSQETLRFQGMRNISGYTGLAKFEYFIKNNDTIFNGDFEFGNILEKEDNNRPVIVKGAFRNNRPDGKWTFQFGDLSQSDQKKLVNYQYVVEINGIQKSIDLNLDNGVPEGKWRIQIDSLKNSEIISTPFKSEFEYKAGIPQKSFRIETDTEFMVGRLLRNAVAHDVWSLYTKEGIGEIESWKFNQGQLEQISIKIDNATKKIALDYGQSKNLTTINLDKHYLDIMELRLQRQDTSLVFDHGMSNLLKRDSRNYEAVLEFFNDLGTSLTVEGFRVNVPEFPLTETQLKTLSLIEKTYQKSDTLIKKLIKNSQLNILKLSDSETEFLYNVVLTLQNDYLKPIEKLVTYQDEDVLRHITREHVIEGLWPNGFPDEVIRTKGASDTERIYVLEDSFYDFSQQNLNSVLELSEFILEVTIKLEGELKEKLSSNKREQAFLIQEQRMVESANQLERQIDSLKTQSSKDIKEALEALNTFADKELSSYSKMEESIQKLDSSQQLTRCFKNTQFLATSISKITKRQKEIEETYQDQVWNPFTATIMDEDIKKRITKAYNEYVIPYYLNYINESLKCDKVLNLNENLNTLHDRMLALKEEETKKLERKLKRTEDASEILSLFGLSNDL